MALDNAPDLIPLENYPPYDFECSADGEEQELFLREQAVPDQDDGLSRTYLASLHGTTVGYITLTADAIELQTNEKPRSNIRYRRLPAIKLAQLAVHRRWEGRGIGKQLVAAAVGIALEVRQRVGCRYLTLDARTPSLVDWYKEQVFKVNKVDSKARAERAARLGVHPDKLSTSMRLDLHQFLQDLQERYPSDFPTEA
jgi:GNAT superfamily N-acetyltransferase